MFLESNQVQCNLAHSPETNSTVVYNQVFDNITDFVDFINLNNRKEKSTTAKTLGSLAWILAIITIGSLVASCDGSKIVPPNTTDISFQSE